MRLSSTVRFLSKKSVLYTTYVTRFHPDVQSIPHLASDPADHHAPPARFRIETSSSQPALIYAAGRKVPSLPMHRWSDSLYPHPPRSPHRRRSRQPQNSSCALATSASSAQASIATSSSATEAINKIIAIVRDEMDKIGQEFFLPALNPRELWEESGRWAGMGENMFHVRGPQRRRSTALGHDLRRGHDLHRTQRAPQLQAASPRSGTRSRPSSATSPALKAEPLRVRQFIMKDSYSFDIDDAGLDTSYNKHDQAYRNIFTRCGLSFVSVETPTPEPWAAPPRRSSWSTPTPAKTSSPAAPPATPPTSRRPPAPSLPSKTSPPPATAPPN